MEYKWSKESSNWVLKGTAADILWEIETLAQSYGKLLRQRTYLRKAMGDTVGAINDILEYTQALGKIADEMGERLQAGNTEINDLACLEKATKND